FLCTFPACRRAFKRHDHLCRHIRCHTGTRPSLSSVGGCGRTCTRSDNLSQHAKAH
ncbi:hypothetical protein BDK51DRAFT_4414, partial [Blyttiomyces helicus]